MEGAINFLAVIKRPVDTVGVGVGSSWGGGNGIAVICTPAPLPDGNAKPLALNLYGFREQAFKA